MFGFQCEMAKIESSLKQPAIFLSTLGGIGYLPKAPGTWASLITLAPVFFIQKYTEPLGLIVFCSLIFIIGIWACTHHEILTKSHDPKHCLIDECLGQSLVLLFTPNDPIFYLLAFVYFRFFDICFLLVLLSVCFFVFLRILVLLMSVVFIFDPFSFASDP